MRNFDTILYEKEDGIAYITLNRPEVLNRYNIQMRDELYQVLTAIRDDADVMVAIFKGAGERAFCVGADLTEFGTAPSPTIARQVRWERDVWGLFSRIKATPHCSRSRLCIRLRCRDSAILRYQDSIR